MSRQKIYLVLEIEILDDPLNVLDQGRFGEQLLNTFQNQGGIYEQAKIHWKAGIVSITQPDGEIIFHNNDIERLRPFLEQLKNKI